MKGSYIPGLSTHILVINEDPDNLKATKSILEVGGYTVTGVHEEMTALEIIKNDSSISIALLELDTAYQAGCEICRAIRRERTGLELPIIVLAPKTMAGIASAFGDGANDYLAVPFEQEELLARVQALVRLRQAVDKVIAAKISSLQAEINPHFIFSSLSVIAALIISDPDRAQDLVIDFSECLRHNLSFASAEEIVPLAEEIEFVRAYGALERARFGSCLDFQIVADDYPEVKIPRLTIQPLVENAIRHGIFDLPKGGHVLLKVENHMDQLHLSVEDNGVGMDTELVDKLLTNGDRHKICLAKIHQRLLRYCGSGLTIKSTLGKGTKVDFSIPLST